MGEGAYDELHAAVARPPATTNASNSAMTLRVKRRIIGLASGQTRNRASLFIGVKRPSTVRIVLRPEPGRVLQRLDAVRKGPAAPVEVISQRSSGFELG